MDANWNIVNLLGGSIPGLESLIYLLVGLTGLYELPFAYQLYGVRIETETKREAADRRVE